MRTRDVQTTVLTVCSVCSQAKGAKSIDDSVVKGDFDVDKQADLCK